MRTKYDSLSEVFVPHHKPLGQSHGHGPVKALAASQKNPRQDQTTAVEPRMTVL